MKKFVVLIAVIALGGCATFKVASAPDEDFRAAAAAVKEKRYQEAVTMYKNIVVQSPRSDAAANAQYQIAYVQTLYDNPQKDYARALQSFTEFIERYPHDVKLLDAENWRFILKMMLDLKKENERLSRSIEELKKLDIRHEEQRRMK